MCRKDRRLSSGRPALPTRLGPNRFRILFRASSVTAELPAAVTAAASFLSVLGGRTTPENAGLCADEGLTTPLSEAAAAFAFMFACVSEVVDGREVAVERWAPMLL